MKRSLADLELLRKRLLARRLIDEETGCWLWQGSRSRQGYGWVSDSGPSRQGHSCRVNRAAAEAFLDFDPDSELQVLHRCDNPPCFNPEHLFIGTAQTNAQDRIAKGRFIARGEQLGSVLTEAQVKDALARREQGEMLKDLAREYGVNRGTLGSATNGKSWLHLRGPGATYVPRPQGLRDHGTLVRYQQGCRCDDCREANAAYKRDYRRRKREERGEGENVVSLRSRVG